MMKVLKSNPFLLKAGLLLKHVLTVDTLMGAIPTELLLCKAHKTNTMQLQVKFTVMYCKKMV